MKGELFSQKFIPKLLDGTKVRTSRPMKPQPINDSKYGGINIYGQAIFYPQNESDYDIEDGLRKPKYQSGDVMYARETWSEFPHWEDDCDHDCQHCGLRDFVYKESNPNADVKWRPSIHMPREAARIFLRVTDVKAQHIDAMTEQDAVEDGFIDQSYTIGDGKFEDVEEIVFTALDNFKEFWLSQYGPNARWMWVYYFKLTSKDEALGGSQEDGKA